MNRIIVINNGAIVESGTPHALASNSHSMFHRLLEEQGNQHQYDDPNSMALVEF